MNRRFSCTYVIGLYGHWDVDANIATVHGDLSESQRLDLKAKMNTSACQCRNLRAIQVCPLFVGYHNCPLLHMQVGMPSSQHFDGPLPLHVISFTNRSRRPRPYPCHTHEPYDHTSFAKSRAFVRSSTCCKVWVESCIFCSAPLSRISFRGEDYTG